MQYQWFPGHMTKTLRQIEENLKVIDLIIEIVDSRIPFTGRNPDFNRLSRGKARLMVFSKSDLADEEMTRRWISFYKEQGFYSWSGDLRKNNALKSLLPVIREACREKIERDRRRGIKNRPVRAMVAGIPNVGKSTFINSVSGSSSLKTGNKPGVTKGRQWIRMGKDIELLDTPGLLWPKFEDEDIGKKIAMIGSMPDQILDTEELAAEMIRLLGELYPDAIPQRYGIEADKERTTAQTLLAIAEERGAVKKGGEPDTERASRILLDDFRSGRLGRMTLDHL